ncbi:MAG: F0F1 ATP synthase subunit delta [Tissierellia bacterium]|nr:F0F1 ATP synthase subunit delta [Tissierellia bacterium]
MAKLVGNRYANALFEAGLELNKLKEFQKDFAFVLDILEKEPKIEIILSHPKISKNEKKDLLNNIFGKTISQEMLNFLYIIVDKRRERYLIEIAKEFNKLFNEYENIVEITAITAVPMNKDSQEKLKVILGNKMNKNIILKNLVDPSILGGVLLKIENKIIDGSIKSQLENVERTIKTGTL